MDFKRRARGARVGAGRIGGEPRGERETHPGDERVKLRERALGVRGVLGAPVCDHQRDRGVRGQERAEERVEVVLVFVLLAGGGSARGGGLLEDALVRGRDRGARCVRHLGLGGGHLDVRGGSARARASPGSHARCESRCRSGRRALVGGERTPESAGRDARTRALSDLRPLGSTRADDTALATTARGAVRCAQRLRSVI